MKVEETSRGGKKGAPRGRGRGQRKTFQKTDLVVTVPNEESGASRLKPPVITTQTRKIVRLSQNRTESTDLEKVTVKSLDEIKREKELRKESVSSTASSSPPSQSVTPASQIHNGGAAGFEGAGKDTNGSDHSSREVKNNKPGSHHGPVIATYTEPASSTSVSNASTAKPKLKNLTIPLKALPALPSAKILHDKPPLLTVASRSSHEVPMDFDSKLAEQDFDYLDEDDEDSSSVGDDYDEDLLLRDHDEMETQLQPQSNNSSVNDDADGLSGFTYTSDEPEDDEISLHPDDSLFEEEDEPSTNNDRLRPRSFGRRSGSQSRDLRGKFNDRQKLSQESLSSTVRTDDEPQLDNKEVKEEKQDMSKTREKYETVPQRSDYRMRNSRNYAHRMSSGERDNRRKARDLRNSGERRIGGAEFRSIGSRRGGHGPRQVSRKGSRPNVIPTVLGLPSLFDAGDGLLQLSGTPNARLSQMQLHTALMLNKANIENNIKTTVEMLTNPPPVPGEVITKFDDSKEQSSMSQGSQPSTQGHFQRSERKQQNCPPRRQQNCPPPGQIVQPVMVFPTSEVPASSPQKAEKGGNMPKWLQKMYEVGSQKSGTTFSQGNAEGLVSPCQTTETDQNASLSSPRGRNTTLERDGSQNNQNMSHHLPNSDSNVEMLASTSKRKSPFHGEEMPHGGKIVVGTSPEGMPQPNLARHINSQEHSTEVRVQQQPVIVQPQNKVDVPGVSYELVNTLLKDENLGAAWEMIEKLRRLNNPPDLSILQHVLSLCSKNFQEPDVAAQVACNAFDMIGGMVVQHNRHNYETLIKTLCHSEQYIRAYEMLELMKKNHHVPTYEVFVDLVQASAKDPEWAFSLLDEIKQYGVFKSKICSDLILLGCNSGGYFIERTWLLFQETLENRVQLTAEAVSVFLFNLFQSDNWDKIMLALPSITEAVPIEILKSAVLNSTQRVDWIETVIAVLAMTPAEKLSQLGTDVWNTFLSNCCAAHSTNMSLAHKICSLMNQNGIPLAPESINNYISAMSHANNWTAALELFTAYHEDPQLLEQPQAVEGGLIVLSSSLCKAGASTGMLSVVHFMMEHHIKPDNSVLQSAVQYLDNEKNYKGVMEFFKQLEANGIVPPLAVYRDIVSSLEKWDQNPTASCEPYAAMRRAIIAGHADAANKKDTSSDSEKSEPQKKAVCRYFGTHRGCFSGNNCRFLHPEGAVSKHEESHPVATQSNNTVPAASMQMVQETGHGSGGSIPAVAAAASVAAAGTINATKPSELSPFMLQSTGLIPPPFTEIRNQGSAQWPPQFRPDDATSSGHSFGSMKSQIQGRQSTSLNPPPFTEARNLDSSQGPPQFRPDDVTSSGHAIESMKSMNQSQGRQLCRFVSTVQGCHWGDSCRYSHHLSGVSMEANSNVAIPEVPSGGSGGAVVDDDHTGNPFVLRGPPSSSGHEVGNALFGHGHDWQSTASSVGDVTSGLHLVRPVSSTLQGHVAKPAIGSHHFQLTSTGHLMGTNPFSPNLPERTRSMDGLGEQKTTEQNRQAHSAPVVPEMPGSNYFNYPSKKSIQFYLPRIKHASQHNSWEDLSYVYINLKNEDVEIDSGVLKAFYEAFATYCPNTIGECFERFSSKVHHYLEETVPEPDPDCSPSSSFDDSDKQFIGQLGVALMYFCYGKQSFTQGYTVLHVLHNFSINYSWYSGEFGMQQRPLTTTEVALTAADICLNLEKPIYSSALEVLRGTNYALPADGNGGLFTPEEANWRRHVFQTLCKKCISEKEFDIVLELLSVVGDIDVFGRVEIKALYNELLVALIDSEKLEEATEVLKTMEANFISRDPETFRALVNGCGDAGLMGQAKQHFVNGFISGVYPNSFNQGDPWMVVIGTSFSAFESQLYIEKHLLLLYQHIEDLASASGLRVLGDSYHRPLKVVIKSDQVHNTGSKYMRRDEIICRVREMLCTMLTNDFNPPLSCEPQSVVEEIKVDALSLKRWFCANPASGRSKRGSVLLSASLPSTARPHPYLQPGMTNVVSENGQKGDGRRVCVVSGADDLAPGQSAVQGEQLHHLAFMNRRGLPNKARPLSSTRTMPGRGNPKIAKAT